jgi:uncharacterized glyoxalase superfamily protein PhnB
MKPKMSLITLGVGDFKRSLAFYRDGLGFPVHSCDEAAGHVMFKLEGSWLSLYPARALAEDAQIEADGTGFARFTIAHNVKSRKDADAVFGAAMRAGATPAKRPQEVFWGGYSGYFADPDGFLWEVAYNPFIDLT